MEELKEAVPCSNSPDGKHVWKAAMHLDYRRESPKRSAWIYRCTCGWQRKETLMRRGGTVVTFFAQEEGSG